MKTIFIRIYSSLLILACFSGCLTAQMHDGKFGNEWIINSQQYYKLKIHQDGFYFIDKQVLQRDIPQIGQINPQSLQLFCMGKEVPIYVHTLNGQIEHIAFYAEKNKGALDVNLYRSAHQHYNPEYSLISDTAAYFLTWNTIAVTKQYQNQVLNLTNLPAKEPYFFHKSQTVLNNSWNRGKYGIYGAYILSNAVYEYGEGYGGAFQQLNTIAVQTPLVYTGGPAATVQTRAYSQGYSYHNVQIKVGNHYASYNNFYGDSVLNWTNQVPLSNLNTGTTNVIIEGLYSATDKLAASVVSISYPRVFDFEGKSMFKFDIKASTSRKYLEISNFNGGASSAQQVYLYDITNSLRIQCFWDGTKVYAELTPSALDRKLVLINESVKNYVGLLQQTVFENYTIPRGDYVVITHPSLYTDSQGNNPVLEYCAYRASTGYSPAIIPIGQLYDQFAYGVEGHPMAIKNFATYIKQYWQSIAPKYVFIIGKGLTYTTVRNTNNAEHLVPSFGHPASDNLLLAPINSDVPVIPVGRLAATTGDQVMDYLNKVKMLERSAKDSLDYDHQFWRKQMVHLGGGANVWEQSVLKAHLLTLEPKIEQGLFGGKVHSFFKEVDEHVSIPNSLMIDSLINNGVSMVTFFGHGSVKGFDYYLDAPEHYSNKNKYPFIMALGCYNGTIYYPGQLISERFIFEKQAGASAYVSFVDAVTISAAAALSTSFYDHANSDLYGGGIGDILKKSLEDVTSTTNYYYNAIYQMGCQYMVFHGDPALKLNYRTSLDFYIDTNSIKTSPAVISENLRNFELLIDVYNFGKNIDSTLLISIVRTHPSGLIDTCYTTIPTPKDKEQAKIIVPINGYEDFGLNKFSIYVDANNSYVETPNPSAENNNMVLNYEVLIGNPVVMPIFPRNYGIVNDSVLVLKAMTSNAFQTEYTWFLELDTVKSFDSPALIQATTQTNSNLLTWTPNMTLENNRVYYWRVQVMSPSLLSDWMSSSFVYLNTTTNTAEGWNQSHVQQYEENTLNNLLLDKNAARLFDFNPTLYEISAKAGFIPDGIDDENLAVYENGSKVDKCRCSLNNGTYVSVLDPNTLTFWTLPGGSTKYGAINCDGANRTAYGFLFEAQSLSGQQSLANFVKDSIPVGHLVVIYTLNNALGQAWSPSLVNYLKLQGATKIDSFVNTIDERSYAIAYRNGYPSYPYFSEQVGYDKSVSVSAYTATTKAWNNGNMTSPLIGPAQSWEKLEWSATHLEAQKDSVSIDLWGISELGEKTLLQAKISLDTFDLTTISAVQYPYLQLVLNNKDIYNLTPAQLNYWRVYGNMTTDVALVVNQNYNNTIDSLGNEDIVLDLSVWNMGYNTIDTTIVKYMILGADTLSQGVSTLYSADSVNIQINIPLLGLVGQQVLIANTSAVKNETNLANNWAWLEFYIADTTSNIVDTTNLITTTQIIENKEESIEKLRNYPNPFSVATTIEFELKGTLPDFVNIEIYDTKGVLVTSKKQAAQEQNVYTWNGQNEQGANLTTGIYFCRIMPLYNNEIPASKRASQKILKLILAR